jgi:hypothetical protein
MGPISDLAQALQSELNDRGADTPDLAVLEKLLEVVFFATLSREESQPIKFDLTYLDPLNPDPFPPQILRSDRWVFVPLSEPLQFDIPSISKVALATDHRNSLLLVYPDSSNDLKIWGFIDQGVSTYKLRSLESDEGFGTPGLFQVSAVDAGRLVIRIEFEQIAELKGNRLDTKPIPALEEGAVFNALTPVFDNLRRASRTYRSQFEYDGDVATINDQIAHLTIQSLRRLLLRVQGYGHGGAVLITPSIRATQLNIKHKVDYPRLARCIQKNSVLILRNYDIASEIRSRTDEHHEDLSMGLYLASRAAEGLLEDARSELDGSLWFVSLLSRIDGLILMDSRLKIRGFGVEILVSQRPEKVWKTHDVDAEINSRIELAYELFGTRHRSMMRYVAKVPGSVGFVISQDGPVRALTMVGPDLVMWDNIQLQLDFSVGKPDLTSGLDHSDE